MIDLARLRELCGKATQEPWILIGPSANLDAPEPIQWQHRYEIRTPDPGGKHDWPHRIAQSPEGQSSAQHKHDFTYIAALNPSVVVALLDRIEEAEHRIKAFERASNEADQDAADLERWQGGAVEKMGTKE